MKKKIRSISISEKMDDKLQEDSNYRGLTISANISRILYDYFEDKPIPPRLKNNGEHEPNKEKKFLKIMKEKYNVKSLEEIL